MTAPPASPASDRARPLVPRRYRQDPRWSEKVAAPLRLVAGPGAKPSPRDVVRLQEGLWRRDEPGAALVEAIRQERSVTMRQVSEALADAGRGGTDAEAPERTPEPLRDFLRVLDPRPAWVDDDLLDRGARACRRFGVDGLRVLGVGSLLGGYRTAAALEPLVRTGRLGGPDADRRIAETSAWWLAVTAPGGLAPGAEGWRLSVHVRVMHAMVNDQLERADDWDWELRGTPINQYDQASTLGVFSTSFLLHARLMGHRVSRRDGDAVMHLWSYVGWLMGVEEEWLPRTERIGRRLLYRFLAGDPPPDQNTLDLARALIDSFDTPERGPLAARWERERVLSNATGLLGPGAMRDLGLPVRPPWFTLWRTAVNVPLTHGLGRVPGTGGLLLRRGNASIRRELARLGQDASAV
ncbi:oxygenase MpaB family protein [Nocardioides campestrisoli]|uniref:oxygenase MpaB family protein n=1 Tax=Nocardioides campestrisoli TaxID=2736757 RepID=UPI00163D6E4D|nr:oxygenase MpaB family protein [Nocardioides campestrisoli]